MNTADLKVCTTSESKRVTSCLKQKSLCSRWLKRLGKLVGAVAAQAKAEASSDMLQYHHAAGRTAARLTEPAKKKAIGAWDGPDMQSICEEGRYQTAVQAVKQSAVSP